MGNDKNITIGIKTVGAGAAASEIDKIPDAIDKIPSSMPAAADAIEKVPDAIDEVTDALSQQRDELGKATEEAKRHSEQLDEISQASRALVAIQTVEMLKKATGALREATAEGGLLHDQLGDLGAALDTVDNGLDMMSAGLGAAAATGNALIGVLVGVASGLAGVYEARQKLRQSEDSADAAKQRAQEMELKHLKSIEFRKQNLSLITQVEGISAENQALAEQEDSLRRMIDLREKLAGQANTAARQEVQLAKLKGGDVALAEANVIATELQGALQTLNDDLTAAKKEATAATANEISANKAWQLAQLEVADNLRGLWDDDTQALKAAAENAAKEGEQAREKLTGFIGTSENSRLEILRNAEIALETKEKEYEGKTSTAAGAAFQRVFNSLVAEQSKGEQTAQQAIAQIQADASIVTTAADTKAQEVVTAMQTAAAGTAQAIGGVGQQAAQSSMAVNQAVSAATKQVNDALNLMTNKMVEALARIAANGIANANRLAQQEARINQLYARIR